MRKRIARRIAVLLLAALPACGSGDEAPPPAPPLLPASLAGRITLVPAAPVVPNGGPEEGPGLDADVYVIAVDATTLEPVSQDVISGLGDLAYVVEDLPPGSYLIVGGTDLDEDGFICDEHEYCGSWPTLGEPQEIPLASGEDRTGVDFAIEEHVPPPAARSAGGGWRRLAER
jgi:hypothetical protein